MTALVSPAIVVTAQAKHLCCGDWGDFDAVQKDCNFSCPWRAAWNLQAGSRSAVWLPTGGKHFFQALKKTVVIN
jgi:hypothetical protein